MIKPDADADLTGAFRRGAVDVQQQQGSEVLAGSGTLTVCSQTNTSS
jgi:hypothetical protein